MDEQYLNQFYHQDWKTIVVKKKPLENTATKKKLNNTTLKKISIENKAENDDLKHKQISIDMRKNIQKARCNKNMTQKELSNKINLSVQIISDIESGKAIYNEQHINKLKRFLKI